LSSWASVGSRASFARPCDGCRSPALRLRMRDPD